MSDTHKFDFREWLVPPLLVPLFHCDSLRVLAAPFDRDKAERARNKFLETQMVIDALERAVNAEERALPSP